MKLRATIIPNRPISSWDRTKYFHVKMAKGVRRFLCENIVTRHIGPRPWSEATWVDQEGFVHELFAKS